MGGAIVLKLNNKSIKYKVKLIIKADVDSKAKTLSIKLIKVTI
jgi:hypothetical protein